MKISAKLALLNAIIIAIFLLEGLLIFDFVKRVEDHAAEVTDDTVPTLAAIPDVGNAFGDLRREIILWVALPPESEVTARQAIAADRAKMAQVLTDYAKTIELDAPQDKDEDTRRYQELLAAEQAYEAQLDKLLTIKDNDGQLKFFTGVMTPLANVVTEKTKSFVKYNLDIAARQSSGVTSSIRQLVLVTIAMSVLGCVLALLIGILIARGISKSLAKLQRQTTDIESSLDFSRRFDANARDEIGVTATALNSLLGVVQTSLQDITGVSKNVGHRAAELATNTAELSVANEMVSNATSAMAAAVEQVNASISHVAERSKETRDLAQHAGDTAASGSSKVTESINRINAIAERANATAQQVEALSQKVVDINAIAATIKGIAEQTNLLALNAAIEAARAGDVGRGFAVVADEVRKLAERTASSTSEITQTIAQIQGEAQQTVAAIQQTVREVAVGVDAVSAVGTVVSDIQISSQQVLSSVNDISEAMNEQNIASVSMAREIEKVAQMTEETSANAMGVADVGKQLNSYSQELMGIVARYRA